MSFNFGTPTTSTGTSSFSFGQTTPQQPSGTGFQFAPTPAKPATKFAFGQQPAQPAGSGFSLGQPATPASSTMMPTFGQTAVQPSTGFNFGQTAGQPASQTQPSLSFGQTANQSVAQTKPGLTFGQTPAQSTSGFNFGQPASQTQSSLGFGQAAGQPTPQAQSSLSFGQAAPQATTGFGFGANPAAPTTVNTSLTFGQTTPASSGLNLTQPQATSGFSFGNKPATTAASTIFASQPASTMASSAGSLSFKSPAPANISFNQQVAPQPSLAKAVTSAAPPGGFSFGLPAATTSTTALSFGSQQPSTTSAPSFNLGQTTLGTSGIAPFGSQSSTSAKPATPALSFGGSALPSSTGTAALAASKPTASVQPGLAFGASPTVAQVTASSALPTSKPGLPAGIALTQATAAATTTTKPGLTFAMPIATTTKAGLSFAMPTATTSSTGLPFGTATTSTTKPSTTVATSSTGPAPTAMTYQQLEELVNKWLLELDEQEKIFLNQATQVNAWDRMLLDNSDKITNLNEAVEKVKIDQQSLENELDFISAQQRELEEILKPLEKSVETTPNISIQQHADFEREHTYQLAENIDGQLKKMAEDLKEIIEHLNVTSSNQDQNDPVNQIAKILNAHMDSLQWIDQNSALIKRKLDEVSKMCNNQRKEQDRLFYT